MINKDKDKFSFNEIVRDVFKYKGIEFKNFKFLYWKEHDGYGKPEAIIIKGFSDFPNGLVEGMYSLLIDTAKITNIDKDSFNILDIYVVSKFMKNIWSGMTVDFTYSEYWSHPKQTDLEHLTERGNKINENIKEALQILSMFFSRYKRHN